MTDMTDMTQSGMSKYLIVSKSSEESTQENSGKAS